MKRKREPVLLVMSILAGLQLLVTTSEWGELVPSPWGKLAALVVAAGTVGMAFYVRGQVTPVEPARPRIYTD
jgi:hypothetical protein